MKSEIIIKSKVTSIIGEYKDEARFQKCTEKVVTSQQSLENICYYELDEIIAKAKEEADGYAIKLSKCDFSSQESSVQICAELNRIGEYGYWNVSISVSPLKELEETILGESYPSFTKEGIEEYFTNQNILFGEKLQAYLCPSLYAKKKA
ncbi:MAG: hypothetical protein J5956_11300 [Ruminococcus sp.]|jgi:hypothetical protein|nr:hypothetical protein [Ruminococcus sp.]